jgi:hypothetical protein
MGLLDPDLLRNKLKGLLGGMPLVQAAQGQAQVSQNGLLAALKAMPVFDQNAGQSAYDAAMNIGPLGLGKIVYHGSPHKFDKFDASKIGTGEGAQAYGHGVYLADSPDAAQQYQMMGAQISVRPGDDGLLEVLSGPRGGEMKSLGRKFSADDARKLQKREQLAHGAFYKADLPDEWIPKMLDWDNSIPEEMRQQISKPMMEKFGSGASGGQGLNQWKQVVWEFKNAGSKQPEIDAANFLREQGVPGIRYLDGGSRGKGQGSNNYVVFPGLEDKVKILERNGIPLNGLLGGK